LCVLGELKRPAAVSDREVGPIERAVLAAEELALQLSGIHTLYQIEWTGSDLYALRSSRVPILALVPPVCLRVDTQIVIVTRMCGQDARGHCNGDTTQQCKSTCLANHRSSYSLLKGTV